MDWYIAKIVFRIEHEQEQKAQFDEQLRLIQAENEPEALEKAQELGAKGSETFLNEKQESVKWVFVNVAELQKLNNITDGMELDSRTEEQEDAERYTNMIHKKARNIQMRTFLQVLSI